MFEPHILEAETRLYRPLAEVFEFFSNAANLNEVTPPEVSFEILTPLPIAMHEGATIDYRIKLMGIPFRWRTAITVWQPPHHFVDEQLRGPYVLWRHTHTFEQKDGYVLMRDHVAYRSPGWLLEPLVHHLFVRARVEAIFAYRAERFGVLFGQR